MGIFYMDLGDYDLIRTRTLTEKNHQEKKLFRITSAPN